MKEFFKGLIRRMLGWYIVPVYQENVALQKRMDDISEAVQQISSAQGTQLTRISDIESREQWARERFEGQDKQLADLREREAWTRDRFAEHLTRICDIEGREQWTRERFEGQDAQLAALVDGLTQERKHIEEHQKHITSLEAVVEADHDTVAAQFVGHQQQLNGHQDQLNSHQSQINELAAKLQTLKDDLHRALSLDHTMSEQYAMMPYLSVCVEGITYFYSSQDKEIPRSMQQSGINYAKTDIENFFKTADTFFYNNTPPQQGIFLDIGGNIGTTTIYCKLKSKPAYRYIAFEPVSENAALFHINCVINHATEDVVLEKVALSNKKISNAIMKIVPENMGHSMLADLNDPDGDNIDYVETTTLDIYISENHISKEDIKYIWIDVEGHELEVLEGASELYTKNKIPTCLEFNQDIYKEKGTYERINEILAKYFHQFMVCSQIAGGNYKMRPVEELWLLWEELQHKACDLVLL